MNQPEREMTKDDWKALYLAWRLAEQICLHGAKALDTFIAAASEMRTKPPERAPVPAVDRSWSSPE